ncbi:unnamed protein product [Amoebophrya sp. A25]|nr:unnamed protein product [Amoebophrya sp. A25]|eukprot:GSA25T00012900001.1
MVAARPAYQLRCDSELRDIVFLGENRLVSCESNGKVVIWDLRTRRPERVLVEEMRQLDDFVDEEEEEAEGTTVKGDQEDDNEQCDEEDDEQGEEEDRGIMEDTNNKQDDEHLQVEDKHGDKEMRKKMAVARRRLMGPISLHPFFVRVPSSQKLGEGLLVQQRLAILTGAGRCSVFDVASTGEDDDDDMDDSTTDEEEEEVDDDGAASVVASVVDGRNIKTTGRSGNLYLKRKTRTTVTNLHADCTEIFNAQRVGWARAVVIGTDIYLPTGATPGTAAISCYSLLERDETTTFISRSSESREDNFYPELQHPHEPPKPKRELRYGAVKKFLQKEQHLRTQRSRSEMNDKLVQQVDDDEDSSHHHLDMCMSLSCVTSGGSTLLCAAYESGLIVWWDVLVQQDPEVEPVVEPVDVWDLRSLNVVNPNSVLVSTLPISTSFSSSCRSTTTSSTVVESSSSSPPPTCSITGAEVDHGDQEHSQNVLGLDRSPPALSTSYLWVCLANKNGEAEFEDHPGQQVFEGSALTRAASSMGGCTLLMRRRAQAGPQASTSKAIDDHIKLKRLQPLDNTVYGCLRLVPAVAVCRELSHHTGARRKLSKSIISCNSTTTTSAVDNPTSSPQSVVCGVRWDGSTDILSQTGQRLATLGGIQQGPKSHNFSSLSSTSSLSKEGQTCLAACYKSCNPLQVQSKDKERCFSSILATVSPGEASRISIRRLI